MKLSDVITKSKVPGIGTVNLTNPVALLQLVVGVGVGFLAIAWGQRFASEVNKKLPANLRETIDPITGETVVAQQFNVA